MRSDRWGIVAAAVAAAAFLPALAGGFVYDDHRFLAANENLGGASILWRAFADPACQTSEGTEAGLWRPLRTLSFAFDRSVFGGAAWGPHLVNVLLHAAATSVVFALLRRFGTTVAGAFLGALVYALHPAQAECVAWISSRGDVLAALLVFAAIAADLAGRTWTALLLGAGALLSKEGAVVWPALAAIASRLAGRTTAAALRRALAPAAVVVVFLVVRHLVLDVPGQEGGLGHGPARAPQLAAMLGHQAWYAFVPVGTVFDWQMPWDEPPAAAYAVAALALATFSWKAARPLTLWFCVALAPTLFIQAFVPLNIMVADRFLSLALPALALVVARCVSTYRGAAVPAAAIVLACGVLTEAAIPAWRSERSLWTATADASPGHWRANFRLGSDALRAGDAPEAVRRFGAAARSGSADGATWVMYAQAIESLGLDRDHPERVEAAREYYGIAMPLLEHPRAENRDLFLPVAKLGYAEMSLVLGETASAEDTLERLVGGPRPAIPPQFRAGFDARVRRVVGGMNIVLKDAALAQALLRWAGLE